MPEGPEVKRITSQLNNELSSDIITNIEVLSGRYLNTPIQGLQQWFEDIEHQAFIQEIQCKGKFIYWDLDGWYLWSTLGMTGSYKTALNDYARVKFSFIDHDPVYYCDMRNFGTLKLTSGHGELWKKLGELGPDMLSEPCTLETWLYLCDRYKNKTVVSWLMEQKIISGVGNIYKSESLYLAAINPTRLMSSLSVKEKELLYNSVQEVLKNAYLQGGSTISNYSDLYGNKGEYIQFPSQHDQIAKIRKVFVYSQKTDPLGNTVEQIKLDDGRTTWWCPAIQK